jgi:hypothetical protein
MKCDAEEGISSCSLLLLLLGKSCIMSGGSYKNVSVSFGVVIYGWIMFAQQQISQHETDRPSLSSPFPLKRCDVGYPHTASVASFMVSLTLCFMKNRCKMRWRKLIR